MGANLSKSGAFYILMYISIKRGAFSMLLGCEFAPEPVSCSIKVNPRRTCRGLQTDFRIPPLKLGSYSPIVLKLSFYAGYIPRIGFFSLRLFGKYSFRTGVNLEFIPYFYVQGSNLIFFEKGVLCAT